MPATARPGRGWDSPPDPARDATAISYAAYQPTIWGAGDLVSRGGGDTRTLAHPGATPGPGRGFLAPQIGGVAAQRGGRRATMRHGHQGAGLARRRPRRIRTGIRAH